MTAVRYCSALLLMMGASIFSFSNAVQISAEVCKVEPQHCLGNSYTMYLSCRDSSDLH